MKSKIGFIVLILGVLVACNDQKRRPITTQDIQRFEEKNIEVNKEIVKLEKKKADADEKIAAELNRKKAEDIVANALANGVTAEEIAELLK